MVVYGSISSIELMLNIKQMKTATELIMKIDQTLTYFKVQRLRAKLERLKEEEEKVLYADFDLDLKRSASAQESPPDKKNAEEPKLDKIFKKDELIKSFLEQQLGKEDLRKLKEDIKVSLNKANDLSLSQSLFEPNQ